jgi:hypothetical protein
MGYSMISERTHKARKRYQCIWCGESILIGEQYTREFSVYDGDVQKHCWHHECKGAANSFFHEEGEDEFAPHENARPLSLSEQEYQSWDCNELAPPLRHRLAALLAAVDECRRKIEAEWVGDYRTLIDSKPPNVM